MEKMFFIRPEFINHEDSFEKLRDFVKDSDSKFRRVRLFAEIDIQDDAVIIYPSPCLSSIYSTEVEWAYDNIQNKLDEGYILTSEEGLKKLLNLPD